MDAESARIHYSHQIDVTVGVTRAFQRDLASFREILVEIAELHRAYPDRDYSHVAREKCDVVATLYAPRYFARMTEQLADLRSLLADASQI